MTATVSEIIVYPIKSLGGVTVQSAEIESRGLQYDRRWMLIDENGRFISQREYPSLALTSVALEYDGLLVKAPGIEPLQIPYYLRSSGTVAVQIWKDICIARKVDAVADSWFSSYLGVPVSLVVMTDESQRPTSKKATPDDIVSFADGYPLLLIGQRSLDDLNSRLEQSISMNRFRPNIVVAGSTPYDEDNWSEITIGSEHLVGISNCSRCVMTTIDQSTAIRQTEPLKTLANYRIVDQKVIFGRNLIPRTTGWIHVGDEVEIL